MIVCVCVPSPLLSKPAISMGVWSRCCRRGQASGEAIERGQRRHRLSGGGWHQRQRRKQRGLRCWIPVPPCAPWSQVRHIDHVQTLQRHLSGVSVQAPAPAPSVGQVGIVNRNRSGRCVISAGPIDLARRFMYKKPRLRLYNRSSYTYMYIHSKHVS